MQSGSPNQALVKSFGEEIHKETNYCGHKSIISKNREKKTDTVRRIQQYVARNENEGFASSLIYLNFNC